MQKDLNNNQEDVSCNTQKNEHNVKKPKQQCKKTNRRPIQEEPNMPKKNSTSKITKLKF